MPTFAVDLIVGLGRLMMISGVILSIYGLFNSMSNSFSNFTIWFGKYSEEAQERFDSNGRKSLRYWGLGVLGMLLLGCGMLICKLVDQT